MADNRETVTASLEEDLMELTLLILDTVPDHSSRSKILDKCRTVFRHYKARIDQLEADNRLATMGHFSIPKGRYRMILEDVETKQLVEQSPTVIGFPRREEER